ncbi:MAG: hypothetical protein ACTHLR_03635 [Rhizomicrobium sp.]
MKSTAVRIGMVVVALLIATGAIGGGLFWLFGRQFYFDPPKADYPKARTPLEAQQQDLDYFRKAMELDRSFSPAAREEAERRVSALERLPAALPLPKLHVDLMQIMALSDNGHSKMRVLTDDRRGLILPVRVTRFADGFYVMRATAPYADMLGGRIESIDGMAIAQMLPELETLRGGTEGFRRENVPVFIVLQDLLYGLGIAHAPRKSTWSVRTPSGQIVSHALTAAPIAKEDPFPYGFRWTSPEPMKGMGAEWRAYAPAEGHLPLSRQQMDRIFERVAIPGSCATYIRIQEILDEGDQKIQPFFENTEAALRAHKPCALIVDLRGNGGGDYTNAWHFAHALPELIAPGGHIYLLTDPDTFSAAITTTAFIKQAGGSKVVIVGEPVGDRLAFYAEGGTAVLPNSRFSLGYETGKHDYAHPCTDWRNCFWLNWLYPVRVKTLQPDVPVPQLFSDWNAGRDAAYDRAVALVAASAKR